MPSRRAIPGTRDVRASLDAPPGVDDPTAADGVVVALPPHPQMGGSRTDARLRAVGAAVGERDLACCRIDYGPWDDGRGEVTDALDALAWAHGTYDWVGLFGYSFGAGIAVLAAADAEEAAAPGALAVLAPPDGIGDDQDVVGALGTVAAPTLVCYGEGDRTVDWAPVVERARELGHEVVELPGGHMFATSTDRAAERVASFFGDCREG